MDGIAQLLAEQSGVVARRQVLAHGGSTAAIERALRRREWVRLLPGVFLEHTGTPTWQQRAWAGVLFYWPAALDRTSALRAAAGPGWRQAADDARIEIAVGVTRTVGAVPGYTVRRCIDLDDRVRWNLSPPRMSLEDAVIDVAADLGPTFDAIAVLADACQSRRTTARRVLGRIAARRRQSHREWLTSVLGDVAGGTCSVLERGYLHEVERVHGLPRPDRQPADVTDRGPIYRDVWYRRFGLVVELDGRLFHDSALQRDLDLDRDLDAAVNGQRSVRLGWGQVFDRSCRTAARVGRLLKLGGWDGTPTRCGPTCAMD